MTTSVESAVSLPPRRRRILGRALAPLARRVGFGRAAAEALAVLPLTIVLLSAVQVRLGRPWSDVSDYASLGVYIWLAWRLAPGAGDLRRRALRAAAFGLVIAGWAGAAWWVIAAVWRHGGDLGAAAQVMPVHQALVSLGFTALSLYLPARALFTLWAEGRTRLRWQLTFFFVLTALLTAVLAGAVMSLWAALSAPEEFSGPVAIFVYAVTVAAGLLLPTLALVTPPALALGYWLAGRVMGRLGRMGAGPGEPAAAGVAADVVALAEALEARERELRAARERAEGLLAANRRLAANVSHELRTPLATLQGYLEALEQEHGARLPRHDMAVIRGEVRRLSGLVDDLFTLARAEAQQLPLQIEAVDAAALLTGLAASLGPLARREREIEVVAVVPEALPQVRADRGRLEQVLLNLAQNALRHTPAGGIVALEGAAEPGGWVALSVADTGVGIAPEELALVFERFYRSDGARSRDAGGAGLGLALVRELTAAMGGEVRAESVPGRGSRFTVVLRASAED